MASFLVVIINELLNLIKACTVQATSAQDINLGSAIEAGTAFSGLTGSNNLSVKCSKNTPYDIALSPAGINTDGTGTLKGTSTNLDTISYKLTSVSTGGSAWGNLSTNDVSGIGSGMSIAKNHPVFATATSTTDVLPDTYKDTVQVSVTY